ncbi:MAG: DUF427 domain-containing protein [Acidimicrobiia bacterium]
MTNTRGSQKNSGLLRRAVWNGAVLAESDDVVRLEGNDYFPADSLRAEHFQKSRAHSLCLWKGIASYYDIVVDGVILPEAAWYYPHPTPLARKIKGRVAFWAGVEVESIPARDPEHHDASNSTPRSTKSEPAPIGSDATRNVS